MAERLPSAAIGVLLAVVSLATPGLSHAAALPKLVIAIGTSLTARGQWLDPLSLALQACLSQPVRVEATAQVGASSSWGVSVADQVAARDPDFVLVEFATNDAALNRLLPPWTSRANLREILRRLKASPSRPRVIVMTMNPVFGRAAWVRPFLSQYEDGYRDVAREAGASFLDMRPIWNRLSYDEIHRGIPDGLHPLPALVTSVLVPALAPIIAGRLCDNSNR